MHTPDVSNLRFKDQARGAKVFYVGPDGKKLDEGAPLIVEGSSTRDSPPSETNSASVPGSTCKWWFDRILVSETGKLLSKPQRDELAADTGEIASSSIVSRNVVAIKCSPDGRRTSEVIPHVLVWGLDLGSEPKTATEIWFSDVDFAQMPDPEIQARHSRGLTICEGESLKVQSR